jgi:hypothetical protein
LTSKKHAELHRRLCIAAVLFMIIFLSLKSGASSSQMLRLVRLRTYEENGESSNMGYFIINNVVYEPPVDINLPEGHYTIHYIPEYEYVFTEWASEGSEFVLPEAVLDNPTQITVTGAGELRAYYSRGPQLHASIPMDLSNAIFTEGPVNLSVRVTSDTELVKECEVRFTIDSNYVGFRMTDGEGRASFTFDPTTQKQYDWKVTVRKPGYSTGYSKTWHFAYHNLQLGPSDDAQILDPPVTLEALVNLDGAPQEDIGVFYYLDGESIGYSKTDRYGRSSYQLTNLNAGQHTWYVSMRLPGFEPSQSQVQRFTYLPRLSADLVEPLNGTVITDISRSVGLQVMVESVGSPVEGGSVSFYLDGEYLVSNVTDAGGLAMVKYSPSLENETYSWYFTVTKPNHTNYTSGVAHFLYPVQPTFIEVDGVFRSREWADVDSKQIIGFHLNWENDTDATGIPIQVSGGLQGVTDELGWAFFDVTCNDTHREVWEILNVTRDEPGLFLHNDRYPEITWDRVLIEMSVPDVRVDVGTVIEPRVTAIHDYDGAPFRGSILYSGLSSEIVGSRKIEVEGVEDEERDISVFTANSCDVIWDRVKIEIGLDQERVDILGEAEITTSAKYEYDGWLFRGELLFNSPMRQGFIGPAVFKVSGIIDEKYGLTTFKTNEVSCVFDDVNVEQEVQATNPTQIQVMTRVSYVSDGAPMMGARVWVNGVGDETEPGVYRSTLFTWGPMIHLRTEVELDGWEARVSERGVIALGNIGVFALGGVSVASVSGFVLFRIMRSRLSKAGKADEGEKEDKGDKDEKGGKKGSHKPSLLSRILSKRLTKRNKGKKGKKKKATKPSS